MRYRFGRFELDDDGYELRSDGRALHVEPRVLDVLFFLVRNRERVVTREELFAAVWKAQFVGEAALSRSIMQARKAVAAAGSDGNPIRTVHRRGYRFVAPVEEEHGQGELPGPAAPVRVDAEAEKLCARAVQLWKKRTPEAMRAAIGMLQEAIEREPSYAPAFALLGDCYLFIGFLQQSAPKSIYPKALAALDRALELDPEQAECHAARGFIESVYGWNPAAASEALTTAIRLNPRLAIAHHRLGFHLLSQRRFDEAEKALRHAAALDPLSPILATACGLPAMARGDAEQASIVYRTVIESEPAFFPVHLYLGLALEASGRLEEAIENFRLAVSVAQSETEALPALGHALARAGREDEALQIAEQLRYAATHRFISPFFFAVVAMGLSDHDQVFESLSEAVAIRAARMSDLHLDPRFAPLHGDARFARLLTEIGTDPEAAQGARWWATRSV